MLNFLMTKNMLSSFIDHIGSNYGFRLPKEEKDGKDSTQEGEARVAGSDTPTEVRQEEGQDGSRLG